MRKKLLALLGALTTFAGFQSRADAETTTLRGTFRITITIVSNANVPLSTVYNAQASVIARSAKTTQSEATAQSVAKTANTQIVTVNVPYQWTLEQPLPGTATLYITVSAPLPASGSNSASLSLSTPLPVNNATTPIAATIRL